MAGAVRRAAGRVSGFCCILAALVLALSPTAAYAGTLEYGGVVVGAAPCSDKWHAAAEMCGYNWDSFSNATKSRLVGTRYSDFYALRSSLVRLDEYMANMPLGSFAMSLVETVSGEDASQYWIANMGVGELTPTIDGAKIDIQFAMRAGSVEHGGGDSGGSGEPETDDSGYVTVYMEPFDVPLYTVNSETHTITADNTFRKVYEVAGVSYTTNKRSSVAASPAQSFPIKLSLSLYNTLQSMATTYGSMLLTVRYVSSSSSKPDLSVWGSASYTPLYTSPLTWTDAALGGFEFAGGELFRGTCSNKGSGSWPDSVSGLGEVFKYQTVEGTTATSGIGNTPTYQTAYAFIYPAGSGSGGSGSGGGGSTSIYNNNDSHDVTTTTTIHNTTNNVSTTTNNVDNTTYVTNNNYETTMDVDLTPITVRLDSIDTKLGAIGRDLDDVYDLLDEQWAGLSGWLSKIYARQALIYSAMDDVVPWLEAMLGEMVNLQHPDSGTSTLLGYVKQIVDKLDNLQVGGGDGSPVDLSSIEELLKAYTTTPDYGGGGAEGQFSVADINSFILEEMRRFNAQMVGYTDEIEDLLRPDGGVTPPDIDPTSEFDDDEGMDAKIADRMGELVKHFPYSLPWDVGIVLNLLRSAPVAPEFDVGVIGSSEDMHIDLSPYEPVAVVTRSGSVVLFAVGLILRTRTLLGSGGDA